MTCQVAFADALAASSVLCRFQGARGLNMEALGLRGTMDHERGTPGFYEDTKPRHRAGRREGTAACSSCSFVEQKHQTKSEPPPHLCVAGAWLRAWRRPRVVGRMQATSRRPQAQNPEP